MLFHPQAVWPQEEDDLGHRALAQQRPPAQRRAGVGLRRPAGGRDAGIGHPAAQGEAAASSLGPYTLQEAISAVFTLPLVVFPSPQATT